MCSLSLILQCSWKYFQPLSQIWEYSFRQINRRQVLKFCIFYFEAQTQYKLGNVMFPTQEQMSTESFRQKHMLQLCLRNTETYVATLSDIHRNTDIHNSRNICCNFVWDIYNQSGDEYYYSGNWTFLSLSVCIESLQKTSQYLKTTKSEYMDI